MFDRASIKFEMRRSLAAPYHFPGSGGAACGAVRLVAFSHRLLSLSIEQESATAEHHDLARQARYTRPATALSLFF